MQSEVLLREPLDRSLGAGMALTAAALAISFGFQITVAGEPQDARIDVTHGRLAATAAQEVRAHVQVLGGEKLRVIWQFGVGAVKDGKSVGLHVHRVTDARRVPLTDETLTVAAEVNWAWDVPAVRGPARYEATLDLPTPVVLIIEAKDRAGYETALKVLARAKVTVTGAKEAEVAALRSLGMKPQAGKAATGNADVVMLVEASGDGGDWRREVRFSADDTAEVVWVAGSGSNDWRVRVPRSWLAPGVLATAEGRIRLVECVVEPPELP